MVTKNISRLSEEIITVGKKHIYTFLDLPLI